MCAATMSWLAALGHLPRADRADMHDRIADRLERSASPARGPLPSPPTMIESVPATAPASPPDSGASRKSSAVFGERGREPWHRLRIMRP